VEAAREIAYSHVRTQPCSIVCRQYFDFDTECRVGIESPTLRRSVGGILNQLAKHDSGILLVVLRKDLDETLDIGLCADWDKIGRWRSHIRHPPRAVSPQGVTKGR